MKNIKSQTGATLLIHGILEVIVLKHIWNYLMPYLFQLPIINYWQSFLICILCTILFQLPDKTIYLRQIRNKLYGIEE